MSIEELEEAARRRLADLASRPASAVKGMAARARATLASEGGGYLGMWELGADARGDLPALVAAAALDGRPVILDGRRLELAVTAS